MPLFLSTFVNKVDKKGRVSVPAAFREALAASVPMQSNKIVIFRSSRFGALEGCDVGRMELLSRGLDNFDQFSAEQADLAAAIFADAQALPFDPEGRVMIPKDFLAHAGIADAAAFVGGGPTFQIWHPDTFKRHQEEARKRALAANINLRVLNQINGASTPKAGQPT